MEPLVYLPPENSSLNNGAKFQKISTFAEFNQSDKEGDRCGTAGNPLIAECLYIAVR